MGKLQPFVAPAQLWVFWGFRAGTRTAVRFRSRLLGGYLWKHFEFERRRRLWAAGLELCNLLLHSRGHSRTGLSFANLLRFCAVAASKNSSCRLAD